MMRDAASARQETGGPVSREAKTIRTIQAQAADEAAETKAADARSSRS
jgi:hypothetical protein